MKRITSFIICTAIGSSFLTACTDEEIATSIGGAALIGGAILIGSNSTCQGGYKTTCQTTPDYWGRPIQECRSYYDSCAYLRARTRRPAPRYGEGFGGHHRYSLLAPNTDSSIMNAHFESTEAVSPGITDLDVSTIDGAMWSGEFGISFASSDRLLRALKDAKDGQKEALLRVGLGPADIQNLTKKEMPTPEGLDRLANILKADKEAVRGMMEKLLTLTSSSEGQNLLQADTK